RPFGPPAVGGSKMRARPRRVSAPPVRPVAHSAGNAADSVVSSGGSKMPPRPAPSNGGRAELAKGRAPGAPAAPCCSPSPARASSLRPATQVRPLGGPRPDGGLTLRLSAPAHGWASALRAAADARRAEALDLELPDGEVI